MDEVRNKFLAILLFLFSLLFLIFTISWVNTISDLMPDTLTKAVFWTGYIVTVLSLLFFKPYLLLNTTNEHKLSIKGVPMGLGLFFLGGIFIKFAHKLLEVLFKSIDNMGVMSVSTNFNALGTFTFIILIVIFVVVGPVVLILYK